MAKEKKSFKDSIKTRADIYKVAEEVASLDDQVERMTATAETWKSFDDAERKIDAEHEKYVLAVTDPKDKKSQNLQDIYVAVSKKASESKKGILPPSSVDEFVAQVAGEIMPHMFHYAPGKEGEKIHPDAAMHAVEGVKHYLSIYDGLIKRQGGESDLYKEIKKDFAEGRANEGTMKMIRAIIAAKKSIETERIDELLVPLDTDDDQKGGKNYDFMMKTAEKIKKDVEAQIGEGKVSLAKIARNRDVFLQMYKMYSNHQYGVIAKNAKSPAKPDAN